MRPLAPIDAAQLFYDLRPREIELAEFGCEDPKKAASKLSEHPALKMLAGHPRRIFNAVPALREVKMGELTAIIEAQIKKEQRQEQLEQHLLQQQTTPSHHSSHHTPKSPSSRSHTPDPSTPSHASPPFAPTIPGAGPVRSQLVPLVRWTRTEQTGTTDRDGTNGVDGGDHGGG